MFQKHHRLNFIILELPELRLVSKLLLDISGSDFNNSLNNSLFSFVGPFIILNGIKPEKQWDKILEASTKIEKLKFESIWVYDHFHTVPSPTQDPTFEFFI